MISIQKVSFIKEKNVQELNKILTLRINYENHLKEKKINI